MTDPESKPPSDGGLRSRHRPVRSDLANDTTELDLWALDDDDLMEGDGLKPPLAAGSPQPRSEQVPPRRAGTAPRNPQEKPENTEKALESDDSAAPPLLGIRMNVGRAQKERREYRQINTPGKREPDFDDLDQWDDVPPKEDLLDLPAIPEETSKPSAAPGRRDPVVTESPEGLPPLPSVPVDLTAAPVAPEVSETDEFSPPVRPAAEPVSLRPHLGLSKLERIGVLTLGVLLLVLGLSAYIFSLNRLPSRSLYAADVDFPVKGGLFEVKGATSYWRAPVLDGPKPDVVRRGTVIIPVVEVTTSSGIGAIRAIFRDDAGKTIGDSITREVRGGAVVSFSSTAGFEDSGMHAAYRAGGRAPWTIEILEAPSTESPSTEFKRLFLMNLSTETR